MISSVISCSLSPNTELDDVLLAMSFMLRPWVWRKGDAVQRVEKWFETYFPGYHATSFNSGRSAMLAILKSFDIGAGDEVIVQAFTCVAVPNSVRWAGAMPVYGDIDKTLNIDPQDVERKITRRTKAIIVQHTFGVPADMDALVGIARNNNLVLIEDCAHSLGAEYKGKRIGTFGDAAFFSFGRDKVVSSVFGGMAIINAECRMQNAKLKEYRETVPYPSMFWIFQQLLHPVAFSLILSLYDVIIGKLLLVVLQKFGLLSFPVYPKEKIGLRPKYFPAKFPNALAGLLLQQLAKLERYNDNRKSIALYYRDALRNAKRISAANAREGSIFLRYPLFVPHPQVLIERAKKRHILLGNWYHHIIDPEGVDYRVLCSESCSCPKAEEAAVHIVNLPTRISSAYAERVVAAIW